MANVDAPFGFRPNSHQAGGTPGRTAGYNVAYNYATALFSGDLVRSVGSGRDIEVVPDGTADRILGVFAGCQYVNDTGDIVWAQYWPGVALADSAKIVEAWVYDDPGMELIAQIEKAAFVAADVGQAYQIITGTGNALTGRSGAIIDGDTVTTPQIRVEGLAEGVNGINPSEYGAFAKVRCRFVNHEKDGGSLAVV